MSAIAGEHSRENSCASSSSGTDRTPASVPATPSILTTTARPAPSSPCHGRTRKSSPLSRACHTARRELGKAAKPADRSDVPKAHACSGKKVRRTAEAEGREGGTEGGETDERRQLAAARRAAGRSERAVGVLGSEPCPWGRGRAHLTDADTEAEGGTRTQSRSQSCGAAEAAPATGSQRLPQSSLSCCRWTWAGT